MKLLNEVSRHEEVLQDKGPRMSVEEKDMVESGKIDCRLVLLESVDASPDLVEHLQYGDHASRDLYRMGFAIEDTISGCPVTITLTANS